ncbi:uncharacterized protein ACJ7VT_004709 [Polymixia lowei]
MEESYLLKERIQAITEKRRVQEDIRHKKQELDRDKLRLQHLKKKALREQWLLEDSSSHNALQQQQSLLADQQQARALQSNIHRIEMEVESLEREESVISTNESFILKRLKSVEKSPEEIIKEAQENFIPEPTQVTTVIPDLPECFSPPAKTHTEPNPLRQTLFAMEINVSKNLLTGESKVVSTATVTPQELNQCSGVKVYDDGRKCVYAMESQQGSQGQGSLSELSPSEVEQLLRDATQHRHGNHQNQRAREGHHYSNHRSERYQEEQQHHHRNQAGGHYHGNGHLRSSQGEEVHCYSNHQKKNCHRKHEDRHHHADLESHYSSQKERNYHSNQREDRCLGNHQVQGHHNGNGEDHHNNFHQERNPHSNQVEGYHYGNHRSNGIKSSSRMNQGAKANGCPPPRLHDQEVVSAYRPEFCYTPANHIPLSDYISVEEEALYLCSPPFYQSYSQSENSHNGDSRSTALFYGSAQSDRAPSPLCKADSPYTILDAVETTEPITAVFLGFQTTQDESGRGQEYEDSIKAELVIIDDNDDDDDDDGNGMVDETSHTQFGGHGNPAGHLANGNVGQMDEGGDKWRERPIGPDSAVQTRTEESSDHLTPSTHATHTA